MTTAAMLLDELRKQGYTLSAIDGTLKVAPGSRLTLVFRQAIAQYRLELVALLVADAAPATNLQTTSTPSLPAEDLTYVPPAAAKGEPTTIDLSAPPPCENHSARNTAEAPGAPLRLGDLVEEVDSTGYSLNRPRSRVVALAAHRLDRSEFAQLARGRWVAAWGLRRVSRDPASNDSTRKVEGFVCR